MFPFKNRRHYWCLLHLLFLLFLQQGLFLRPTMASELGLPVLQLSYSKSWALKLGPSYHSLNLVSTVSPYPQQLHTGPGLHTHIGYRWNRHEFNISSYVFVTMAETSLQARSSRIYGKANISQVIFSPNWRFFLFAPFHRWNLYIMGGPALGQLTLKMQHAHVVGGEYSTEHKLTVDMYGFQCGWGFDIHHPYIDGLFIEMVYHYLRGTSVYTVGGTRTAVETLATENNRQLHEHTFTLALGGRLF